MGRFSGRGGRGGGGRGSQGRGNQSRGSGGNRATTKSTAPKEMGLCKDLGSHVFSYGHKGSADQFRTTLEQVVHYVGTKHGQSISTELDTRTKVIVPEPVHDQALIDAHELDTAKLKRQKLKLINAMFKQRAVQDAILESEGSTKTEKANAELEKAVLENKIEDAQDEIEGKFPLKLEGDDKTKWQSQWKIYSTKVDTLDKHRGQAFSLLLGQCTEMLVDHMEFQSSYAAVKMSQDPLQLLNLIEQTILGHAEDTYPCAQIYNQLVALLGMQQHHLTNSQFYEKFNTRASVAEAAGVGFYHTPTMDHIAREMFENKECTAPNYKGCPSDEQVEIALAAK